LDAIEQKYLALLRGSQGTLRLNVIASALGLPRATLERSIEPFLIRAQLIQKDDSGRSLTEKGWQHLGGTMARDSHPPTVEESNVNQGDDRACST
jgi:Holliday junction DNA helicase RuvB